MGDQRWPTGNGVSLRRDGDVVVINIDDGKANALSHGLLAALDTALTTARAEAKAMAVIGRENRFSGGFDLAVMRSGPAEASDLVHVGARVAHSVFVSPIPVVIGCTGHAIAMGALLLLSADLRIGAEGPYKIGLNEVAIGMPLPRFGIALARERLSPRHLTEAVNHARLYDPEAAIEAGFLDRLVAPAEVEAAAVGAAQELAERLHPAAFRFTRELLRGPSAERLTAAIEADRGFAAAGEG
jgi:enoyl-CoA hydratase